MSVGSRCVTKGTQRCSMTGGGTTTRPCRRAGQPWPPQAVWTCEWQQLSPVTQGHLSTRANDSASCPSRGSSGASFRVLRTRQTNTTQTCRAGRRLPPPGAKAAAAWRRRAEGKGTVHLPVFRLRCSVPLPSVFEPVGDLRGGEARRLGQLPLLPGRRVRVVGVPLSQDVP